MIQKKEVPASKNFCMAPWVTIHAWPNGQAFPCCAVKTQGLLEGNGMANLNEVSISEAWNSEMMKTLRKNMLEDKPTDICEKCVEFESHGSTYSLRKHLNREFYDKYWERVTETNADGTHDDPKFLYWDIRFNNLCNMRCRSCGPAFSSSWYDDAVKLHNHAGSPFQGLPKDFWENALPLIKQVEYAYFAGGEPLITNEHYKMLDVWLEEGNTEVRIDYTTNFSKMKLGNKHVFDYWNKFKNVNVGASLDASYERGEYMRKGTVWKDIVQNRRDMIAECPNTKFFISPTISIYNVLHLPDFHQEWIEEGLVDYHAINLNTLMEPDYMRIQQLPYELKVKVEQRWLDHIDWIDNKFFKPNNKDFTKDDLYPRLHGVIKFLWAKETDVTLLTQFINNNKRIDAIRKENFYDAFPELENLKDYESQ